MAGTPDEIDPVGRGRPAVTRRSRLVGIGMTLGLSAVLFGVSATSPVQASTKVGPLVPGKSGELDCNAYSASQKSVRAMTCTDIKGILGVDNQNTWGGKFYDNGHYIGHDEPDATFNSSQPGSGGDITWDETLGADPSATPTDAHPGTDVSHWFELSPAPWLSMALCDPNSYPQAPCTPNSDSNAPSSTSNGGGSTFMEMQFYPPGEPPFVDSSGCDSTHWCAALTIDSLECTEGFATCNANCEEPVNFAFIQNNGVPTGAPSPQDASLSTFTPNSHTLLMNPGDKVTVHMSDQPAPGGGKAFEVVIDDLTLHTSGSMQASAANGFANTSIANCSGTPFNFQPEYNTAKAGNIIPWAAIATDVSTEFETGHWESCTSLTKPITNPFDPQDAGGDWNGCQGPYEKAGGSDKGTPEVGEAECYKAGDTHPGYDGAGTSTAPDQATGCQDNTFQNGDLDFDGSPYWTEWPTGRTAGTYPSSFIDTFPTTGGSQYSTFFFQTDIALSESSCTSTNLSGCTVPPDGPGNFYPYWSETRSGPGQCAFEFGNVWSHVVSFGKDAEYGTNQFKTLGYPEFIGKSHSTSC